MSPITIVDMEADHILALDLRSCYIRGGRWFVILYTGPIASSDEVIRFFSQEVSHLHGLRKLVITMEKTTVLDVNGDGIEFPGLTYGSTTLEDLLRYLGVVFKARVLHD